eukprot:3810542-Rhodomonas_salina.3
MSPDTDTDVLLLGFRSLPAGTSPFPSEYATRGAVCKAPQCVCRVSESARTLQTSSSDIASGLIRAVSLPSFLSSPVTLATNPTP